MCPVLFKESHLSLGEQTEVILAEENSASLENALEVIYTGKSVATNGVERSNSFQLLEAFGFQVDILLLDREEVNANNEDDNEQQETLPKTAVTPKLIPLTVKRKSHSPAKRKQEHQNQTAVPRVEKKAEHEEGEEKHNDKSTCPKCDEKLSGGQSAYRVHMTHKHFRDQLWRRYGDYFRPNKTCGLCDAKVQSTSAFVVHVGSTHRRVNEFLSDDEETEEDEEREGRKEPESERIDYEGDSRNRNKSNAYKTLQNPTNNYDSPAFVDTSFENGEKRPLSRKRRISSANDGSSFPKSKVAKNGAKSPGKRGRSRSRSNNFSSHKQVNRRQVFSEEEDCPVTKKCSLCFETYSSERSHDEHLVLTHFKKELLSEYLDTFNSSDGVCPYCSKRPKNLRCYLVHIGVTHRRVFDLVKNETASTSKTLSSSTTSRRVSTESEIAVDMIWACPVCRTAVRPSKARLYQHIAFAHFKSGLRSKYLPDFLANASNCQFCGKIYDEQQIIIHIGAKHKKIEDFLRTPVEPTFVKKEPKEASDNEEESARAETEEQPPPSSDVDAAPPAKKRGRPPSKSVFDGVDLGKNCPFCNEPKQTMSVLLTHASTTHCKQALMDKFHSKYISNGKRCPICNDHYTSEQSFYSHIGSVHKQVAPMLVQKIKGNANGREEPPICGDVLAPEFVNYGASFQCQQCAMSFYSEVKMTTHVAMEHYYDEIVDKYGHFFEKDSSCHLCHKKLNNVNDFVCHLATIHHLMTAEFTPQEQGEKEDQSQSDTEKSHVPKCPECFKVMANRASLLTHFAFVHHCNDLDQAYGSLFVDDSMCGICNTKLDSKKSFIRHVGISHHKVLDFVHDRHNKEKLLRLLPPLPDSECEEKKTEQASLMPFSIARDDPRAPEMRADQESSASERSMSADYEQNELVMQEPRDEV